jgi:plasmid stabilization system protein ParE
MSYRVLITANAENDLRALHRYIRKYAPQAANAWIGGMRSVVKTLAQNPDRAHLAPEAASFNEPIRELLYGKAVEQPTGFSLPLETTPCLFCTCVTDRCCL